MSSPSSQPVMDLSDWLLLLLLSLLWGASFFFGKIAVAEWQPLAVVLARVGMAAAALLLVVRLSGQLMRVGGRMWLAFFGMGLLNNLIPFGLIFWGQTQINIINGDVDDPAAAWNTMIENIEAAF